MPFPKKTKAERDWYHSPFDYSRRWRARAWGPLEQRRRFVRHPLRAIFQAGAMSHDVGLRWLKAKGYIGDRPQCVEDIPALDVDFILDEAQSRFSMEWIEDLRERWKRNPS
jgi:hypothetical protein